MGDNPLLVAAGRFHGHIGPFLAIGLRMGLVATERLGRAPMKMRVVVRVMPRPPRSCVVDGVQYSTGCTMGKANIEIQADPDRVAADVFLGPDSVSISLRQDFLRRIESDLEGAEEKAIIDYAFRIMDTATDEILEVT
jgi:formylmethanofuran dehydrogenase subunit E